MYPPPTGHALSQQRARDLDDAYLTADPHAYFRARISGLLLNFEEADGSPGDSASSRLRPLLGELARTVDDVPDRARELQVAIDAFALRHHAAEALLRLTYALVLPVEESSGSLWVDLSLSPTRTRDVIASIKHGLERNKNVGAAFRRLVLRDDLVGEPAHLASAASTYAEWFDFALDLVQTKRPDLSAAHNKFKHGLGARPIDDVLATFSTVGPGPEGNIPLHAVTGDSATPLFSGLTLEYLTRGPRKGGITPAFESTQINLDSPRLLAEAAMIAHTHGAMFHVAAYRHFRQSTPGEGRSLPPYPPLPVGGPLPRHTAAQGLLGVRMPLSTASDGTTPDSLFFHGDGSWQTFEVTGEIRRGRVSD